MKVNRFLRGACLCLAIALSAGASRADDLPWKFDTSQHVSPAPASVQASGGHSLERARIQAIATAVSQTLLDGRIRCLVSILGQNLNSLACGLYIVVR